MVINHVRPVQKTADLQAIVPFNKPWHFNTLNKESNESFDEYLSRTGYPNAISTFGRRACPSSRALLPPPPRPCQLLA